VKLRSRATVRKAVTAAIGHHIDLLAIKLDVTRLEDAHAAVAAAVTKFGRIDVVVNNAGNFYAGFFEELSAEQMRSLPSTTTPSVLGKPSLRGAV